MQQSGPVAESLEARVHELEVELHRVIRERDILKNIGYFWPQRVTDVYAAVDNIVQSGATKTAVVCEVLKLSRSAYYVWRTRKPTLRQSRDVELAEFWETDYRQQVVQRAMQIMQAEFSEKVWQSCWQHIVLSRPAADVATELSITANAVRVYSSRVLARLRTELSDLLDE